MPKGVIKNPCPGAGKPPAKITHQPRNTFSGYGNCADCGHNIAMTKSGNLMTHKDRRVRDG